MSNEMLVNLKLLLLSFRKGLVVYSASQLDRGLGELWCAVGCLILAEGGGQVIQPGHGGDGKHGFELCTVGDFAECSAEYPVLLDRISSRVASHWCQDTRQVGISETAFDQ